MAHGWVTLLDPLTPGAHTIVGTGSMPTFTTKIVVQPAKLSVRGGASDP